MKLSDEEIKAIEKVKEVIRIDKERRIVTIYDEKPLFRDQLQTLIDLIDKQREEIEKLKFNNHMVGKWNKYLDKDCISKDKIRDILDYLNDTELNNYEIVMAFQKMMKELLEDDGDHIPRID